jgi:hypothetical protein
VAFVRLGPSIAEFCKGYFKGKLLATGSQEMSPSLFVTYMKRRWFDGGLAGFWITTPWDYPESQLTGKNGIKYQK